MLSFPVFRGDNQLAPNMRRNIAERRSLADTSEHIFTKLLLALLPIDAARVVGHRNKHVERGMPGWCTRWVGSFRIADVERYVLEMLTALRDRFDVLLVVARKHNHVVFGVV